jgi:tRNA dimethylallyltransferase
MSSSVASADTADVAHDAIVIAGPTASGKSDVAVEVARLVGGEVISFDSRQVYRGMNIGTAKPTAAEQGGIRHHGFDLVDPSERFNAGRFADLARRWLSEIRSRATVPVLAGGTGFFLRALTHPMFAEPVADASLREAWKRYLREVPVETLVRWAAALDPAHTVRPVDRQRLSRLIEIALITGRPLSWWHRTAPVPPPAIDPLVFVLDLPRDLLTRRIDQRVDRMLQAGLVDEVRALLDAGYTDRDPGFKTTGYLEVLSSLRGERPLAEAADQIRATTRQYARRQVTWLRHQLPPHAVWLDATPSPVDIAALIAERWSLDRRQPNADAADIRVEESA